MGSSAHFDQVVKQQLDKCKTPAQMLEVLNQNFDLDQEIGMITALAFKQGLRTAVSMINPKVKTDGVSH
jgi:hypothetical protein